jgi:hypothetical protein
MARSTIQEKLSGKSALNLPQILAIVDALAQYAQDSGIPLPKHELDRKVWQDRIAATTQRSPTGSRSGSSRREDEHIKSLTWNIAPLQQAQMSELIELIRDYQSKPVGDWLPRVLRAMVQAEMNITGFLKTAAEDSPRGVVNTIRELHKEFPYEGDPDPWGSTRTTENLETVGNLVSYAAMRHGDTAAPPIVVGLRLAGVPAYTDDFLKRIATWFLAPEIIGAVDMLRAAALDNDAATVLRFVAFRSSKRIHEVVAYLEKEDRPGDELEVLRALGTVSAQTLQSVVADFVERQVPESKLLHIAQGVAHHIRSEAIRKFETFGDKQFAELLRRTGDEPPF